MSDFDIIEETLVECLNEEQLKSIIAIADVMISMRDITPECALSKAREYVITRSRFWELEYSRLVIPQNEQQRNIIGESTNHRVKKRPIGFHSTSEKK